MGILAIQESHLSETHIDTLHGLFRKRMKIFHTIDQQRPNAKGVAIVLNKELVKTDDAQTQEIIPGRALLLKLKWHNELTVKVLAIYAPNAPTENAAFWGEIARQIEDERLDKPDICL